MRVAFYRSLDREFEIFGIKGRWVTIALVGLGAALLMGFIFGGAMGTGMGVAAGVVIAAVVFFGSITLQVKTPSRRIEKAYLSSKAKGWIVRRETLSRILLDDPRYGEYKKELELIKNR